MKRSSDKQKGMAMFMALMLILILSVMGVSMAFLAQSETWSGANYRMMNQARYGAEAGLQSAANFFVGGTYTAPASSGTDQLSNYVMTVSPVTYNGNPVVLSTTSSAANYPVASVETAFRSAASGSITEGSIAVNYTATATLVAMQQIPVCNGVISPCAPSGPITVQTWSITADGSINSVRNATEEVTGLLERQVTFAASANPSYGVFGTGSNCGTLNLSGGTDVASYDSKNPTMSGGHWTWDQWGGDIGANGNLNESGNPTHVYGTMSTPRTGVGNCASGGVDAWSDSGGATVTGCQTATTCVSGGLVHLAQAVTYNNPVMPAVTGANIPPTTNVSITKNSTCASLGYTAAKCTGAAGALVLAPGVFGNISLSGGAVVTLSPGTYYINTISTSGNSTLNVNNTSTTTLNVVGGGSANTLVSLSGQQALDLLGTSPVTVNLISNTANTPFTTSGGGITNINASGVPTPINLTINYAGTNGLSFSGGTATAAAVYAPSAPLTLSGGSAFYGSLIGASINDSGGVAVYYDRELGSTSTPSEVATVGNFMMDSFSWSRY